MRSSLPPAAAMVVALVAASSPSIAAAEDLSPVLSKADVTPLVVGKKVSYVRKRDGAKQAYDFKGEDTVYFTTSTTTRNTSFSGTYTIADDGAVCFKWNADKYMVMRDGCIYFRRAADKLVLVSRGERDQVFGEVE